MARLLHAVVDQRWADIVRFTPVEHWAQALAAVITYASSEVLSDMCTALAERLEREAGTEARGSAGICYVCAGRVSEALACWERLFAERTHEPAVLLQLVEQASILRLALAAKRQGMPAVNEVYVDRVLRLCTELAEQGALMTAQDIARSALHSTDPSPGGSSRKALFEQRLGVASGRQPATPVYGGPVAQPQPQPQPSVQQPSVGGGLGSSSTMRGGNAASVAHSPVFASVAGSGAGGYGGAHAAYGAGATQGGYGAVQGGYSSAAGAGAASYGPPSGSMGSYSAASSMPGSYVPPAAPAATSYAPPPPVAMGGYTPPPAAASYVQQSAAYAAPPPAAAPTYAVPPVPAAAPPLQSPPAAGMTTSAFPAASVTYGATTNTAFGANPPASYGGSAGAQKEEGAVQVVKTKWPLLHSSNPSQNSYSLSSKVFQVPPRRRPTSGGTTHRW